MIAQSQQRMAVLTSKLVQEGVLKTPRVIEVFKAIDRADFTPQELPTKYKYEDSPFPIGYNVTISAPTQSSSHQLCVGAKAPHMHCYALEYLEVALRRAKKSLDVGSGTGYLTLAMALLMPAEGRSFGVEHIPELVQSAAKNVERNHAAVLQQGRVVLLVGDGREGLQSEAPFDVIHVGASAEKVPPALVEQLAVGGRIVIPVGDDLLVGDKLQDGRMKWESVLGVRFVPLTDKSLQLRS